MYKMMIRLDELEFNTLVKSAQEEHRATREQAEVILRRGLGLPFPRVQPTSTALKEVQRERQAA